MLVTRPFFGKLVDQKGFGAGIWTGVLMIPAALLLLSISNSIMLFLICAVIYGVGVGAAQSSLQTMAIIKVPKERTGAANATFFTGFDGGIGVGAVLAGIVSSLTGYGAMFACMAIFPVLGGLLYIVLLKVKGSVKR
jgi:predicted MFS family arabinose efflux permease